MDFLKFYICKYKKKYTKFEYNGDTLVKLYDIYHNKPDELFYGYITTDVNKYNL